MTTASVLTFSRLKRERKSQPELKIAKQRTRTCPGIMRPRIVVLASLFLIVYVVSGLFSLNRDSLRDPAFRRVDPVKFVTLPLANKLLYLESWMRRIRDIEERVDELEHRVLLQRVDKEASATRLPTARDDP